MGVKKRTQDKRRKMQGLHEKVKVNSEVRVLRGKKRSKTKNTRLSVEQ